MLSSTVSKLASSSRVLMAQTRGIGQHKLPKYDAAASIPMKYGLVYMGVVFAFSGLVFMTNPFNHTNMHETYEKKWKNQ